MKTERFLTYLFAVAMGLMMVSVDVLATDGLQLATFQVDITPPVGEGVGLFDNKTTEVEHPLYARGVVLKDGGGTYVLCSLDLGGLWNETHALFLDKLAKAAQTEAQHVAVHSIHQHTAPFFDATAARMLYQDDLKKQALGLDYTKDATDKIAVAIEKAMQSMQVVSHVGTAKAKAERVASNRRVPGPNGTLLTRYSAVREDDNSDKDEFLRNAPEGLIDPWVRTVTFYDGDKALVQMHYYAMHPQTVKGTKITYDVPGLAVAKLQKETGVPQMYFTGCGGNLAMGKYNRGIVEDRAALAERLYQAMARAAKSREDKEVVSPIIWRSKAIDFPLREEPEFTLAAQQKILNGSSAASGARAKAALLVAWIARVKTGKPIKASCLSMGKLRLLHLPGEPFVQFQLAAQKSGSGNFVATAALGELGPCYIGEDRIYTDVGGYEQSYAFAGPCEEMVKKVIARLVK
ncbi:MAG: hypothetical protein QM496_20095 [Verrucomicrobiota bacterium]